MRTLAILIAIIILQPLAGHAQNLIQLGANVGVSPNFISGEYLTQKGTGRGIMGSAVLLADFKHWQIGACLELSSIKGEVYATEVYTRIDGSGGLVVHNHRFNEVANPLVAPHLLANYKYKINNKLYCYAGGLAGIATAKNDFIIGGLVDGYMLGLNIGAVWRLNETLSLNATHGWRYSNFKIDAQDFDPEYPELPHSFTMQSFPLMVGVRVRFAN